MEHQVLTVLGRARPDDMLAPLQELLREHLGATDVQILLMNHQLTALRPIHYPGAGDDAPRRADVDVDNTLAGQAFNQQKMITRRDCDGRVKVAVPVGVRGERLGILALTLGEAPDESARLGLSRIADTLAYAVQAAAQQTDAMARAARSRRLTLAAELQWQLLPGRGCQGPEYQLAGHLEPAYQAQTDTFDWSQDKDHLVLNVTDSVAGRRGVTLLPTLAVTALRNARRAGLSIADQAFLASEAVYAHHGGLEHISTLLVDVNLSTGQTTAVRAGSPRLFIHRGSSILEAQLSEQDPLGMFQESEYAPENLRLEPGDRLLLLTDGVYATRSTTRERYADNALIDLLENSSNDSVATVSTTVINGLHDHVDNSELNDDAAILIIEWTGPPTTPDGISAVDDATESIPLRPARRPRLTAI